MGISDHCSELGATATIFDPVADAQQKMSDRAGETQYELDLRDHLLDSYATLTYDKMVDRTPLVDKLKEEVLRRLANSPAERASLEATIGAVFDVHRGIESISKEDTALRENLQPVTPVRRDLVDAPNADGEATGDRTGDFVYDVPVTHELAAMIRADPSIVAQLDAASRAWASERPPAGASQVVYADISDGAVVREHPELGVKADRSDGSVRLAFILYYDDLEVVNPLGAFHGKHKLGMFYWALVNVEPATRMAFHNLHLATVALVSDIDYYGIEQIVSGLPGDSSFGSSMTSLHAGETIVGHLFRGWVVVVSADYPAAGLLAGFKKSVSASLFCRECDCDKSDECYPLPSSFLEENDELGQHYTLRDRMEYQRQLDHYLTLSTAAERIRYLTSIGVTTFEEHAFTRIPLFDLCTMIPYDFMHVELEGVCEACVCVCVHCSPPLASFTGSLKNELAAMLYYFQRKRNWGFTIQKLNERIRSYVWPPGFRMPSFTEGYLEKGTKQGQCKKGAAVPLSASPALCNS
eukprot:3662569-Prymnesium_polylepis.1